MFAFLDAKLFILVATNFADYEFGCAGDFVLVVVIYQFLTFPFVHLIGLRGESQ
jgi:hypothetical protein